MTDMIEWGAPIEVNGIRPEWLNESNRRPLQFQYGDLWHADPDDNEFPVACWEWSEITAIRLAVSHAAYTAINAGFVPWRGGDVAPVDWDGGEVMFRNGGRTNSPRSWTHPWNGIGAASERSDHDIIGYHRKAEPVAESAAIDDHQAEVIRHQREEIGKLHSKIGVMKDERDALQARLNRIAEMVK